MFGLKFTIRSVTTSMLIALVAACCGSCIFETVDVSAYPDSSRPLSMVMDDLRHGQGVRPPNVRKATIWHPLLFDQPSFFDGHGWLSEGDDLGREAIEELQRREKAGKLPAAERRQIDQLALADLDKPLKTPGQYYLRQNLGDRWMSDKLPNDEVDQLYKIGIRLSVVVAPMVIHGDDVPLRLRCDCFLPNGGSDSWGLRGHYKSISIDGNPVERSDSYYRDYADPDWAFRVEGGSYGGDVARTQVPCSKLGLHHLEVKLWIDILRGLDQWPEHRLIMYTEVVMLDAEFKERLPSIPEKCYRFLLDPEHEILHYISAAQLQMLIDHPMAYFSNPAMLEFMRRRRLADVTPDESQKLIADLLAVQKDRSRHWFPEYGDNIESLHDQHALTDSQWKQYGAQQLGFYIRSRGSNIIKQGDPLPIEFVEVARRGNSKDSRYAGAQWKINISLLDGVSGDAKMDDVNLGIQHEGDEYPVPREATFASVTLGTHTMRANITGYDLTWTARPADLVIPTDYDLGEIKFTVVPKPPATRRSR